MVAAALELSTGKDAGHAGQQFQKIVHGSSSGRIRAEFLADADEYKRLQGGVPAAFHRVALLGREVSNPGRELTSLPSSPLFDFWCRGRLCVRVKQAQPPKRHKVFAGHRVFAALVHVATEVFVLQKPAPCRRHSCRCDNSRAAVAVDDVLHRVCNGKSVYFHVANAVPMVSKWFELLASLEEKCSRPCIAL